MQQEPLFSISGNAATRLSRLLASEPAGAYLRVAVNGGGCSGFQYHFDFDAKPLAEDDILIERGDGVKVVVDTISLDFIKGAELDYVETLGAASFEIKNPNATASCGCGNSFSV